MPSNIRPMISLAGFDGEGWESPAEGITDGNPSAGGTTVLWTGYVANITGDLDFAECESANTGWKLHLDATTSSGQDLVTIVADFGLGGSSLELEAPPQLASSLVGKNLFLAATQTSSNTARLFINGALVASGDATGFTPATNENTLLSPAEEAEYGWSSFAYEGTNSYNEDEIQAIYNAWLETGTLISAIRAVGVDDPAYYWEARDSSLPLTTSDRYVLQNQGTGPDGELRMVREIPEPALRTDRLIDPWAPSYLLTGG